MSSEDKPAPPSTDALVGTGKGLKKATTEVKTGEVKASDVEAIVKQWAGDFDKTAALDAFKGLTFRAKFVEEIKKLPDADQPAYFANGILNGTACE